MASKTVSASPQPLPETGAPRPSFLPRPGSAARNAARSLPGALRRALLAKTALSGSACALAAGLLLPGLLSYFLKDPPGSAGPSSRVLGASFVLNMGLLAAVLASLPEAGGPGWPFSVAGLRAAGWAFLAFAGLKLSPGSRLGWGTAMTLLAVSAAQCAALGGAGGVLSWWAGRYRLGARTLLALFLALAVSALLWSRPWVLNLYRAYPGSPRAGDTAAQAVVSLSPVTGLAAVWNRSPARFDLLKGPNTYRVWIGSYQPVAYPRLWPARIEVFPTRAPRVPEHQAAPGSNASARSAAAPRPSHPWAPGLVLGFFAWGAVLLGLSDLLGWLQASRNG